MTLTAADRAARDALRARQGAGARWDAKEAPGDDLLLARRGTAYFARQLNNLADADLAQPSALPGRSRAHVVARVSCHARDLARRLHALRTGAPAPPPPPPDAANGATLPPRALRSLFHHTAIHLDVEWRDLAGADWDRPVPAREGDAVPVRATPMQRARLVWSAALDLGAGGRMRDLPPGMGRDA